MVSVLDMVADRGISFMGKAQVAISGGQLVKAMSVATPGATGMPADYIELDLCDAAGDDKACVGIALHGAASGDSLTVATKGIFRMYAAEDLTVGGAVAASADPLAVHPCTYVCTGSTKDLEYEKKIGTALTTAASGERCFVHLNV
ncbi:MAG: capsid cement protein [Candidatus Heimdallarchaeota archaeon]